MIPYSQHPFAHLRRRGLRRLAAWIPVPGGAGRLCCPLLWKLCTRWLRRQPWFDPVFKDVRQKLVDVRAGWLQPAAHGDVVEEGRQRCWNRLFLGKTDATDCATRTGDAAPLSDRSFAPGVLGI
jgi:hypothetical protein